MKHSSRTVQSPATTRKSRFLAALRIAGVTMEQWADANGTRQGYVSNLLAGRRSNAALERKIERFTAKHLSDVKVA